MSENKKYIIPFLLVSLLFLMWGLANNMNDTLLAAFRRIMSMSDMQSSLVQTAFFGAYFCFSLPAALFIKKFSYKAGVILGLLLYAVGTLLFYPAGEASSYPFFLFAIYVMAGGCAILETTSNPYILSMGAADTATRRLNIAQTFNPVGAICGILISRHFILSQLHTADASDRLNMTAQELSAIQHEELNAISSVYSIIGIVLLLFLVIICFYPMPGNRSMNESNSSMMASFRRLIHNQRYRNGVITQFFYVGAQTCIWSFTIRYVMQCSTSLESGAALIFLYSIICFTLFRFLFTWLMKYFSPVILLRYATIGAVVTTLIVVFFPGQIGIYALPVVSAFMSLMFPTIYGEALDGVTGNDAKIASSGLIMAILGGAIITPLQALVSDSLGIVASFLIPAVCFLVVLTYAYSLNIIRHN